MSTAFENLKQRQQLTAPKPTVSAFDALKQRQGTISAQSTPSQAPKQDSVRGGIAGEILTGNTQRFGKTIGESIAAPANADKFAEASKAHSDVQANIAKKVIEKRQNGEDASRFEQLYEEQKKSAPKLEDFSNFVLCILNFQ